VDCCQVLSVFVARVCDIKFSVSKMTAHSDFEYPVRSQLQAVAPFGDGANGYGILVGQPEVKGIFDEQI
jgi:hypothetical protein